MEEKNIYKGISIAWYEREKINGLKKKGLFSLTLDDVADIMEDQYFKCYYSSQNLVYPRTSMTLINEGRLTLINSSVGYARDNVRFVSKTVNVMKQDMSETEFISLCKTIGNKKY